MTKNREDLPVSVTLLVDGECILMHIEDVASGVRFLELRMTPEAFTAALGRRAYCPAEARVRGLDRIGLQREQDEIIFPMPDDTDYRMKQTVAIREAMRECPDGWEPDLSFSSQDSFFQRDGKEWARTTIRRWVEPETTKGEE